MDITTIPMADLERDLQDSRNDISVCEVALLHGVTDCKGESVEERLKANKHFVDVITKEINRRREVA